LTRTVVPESPVRVEYELTAKGRALQEALEAIGKWATRWIDETDLARAAGDAAATPKTRGAAAGSKRPRTKSKRH
jgi:DNA-binding HxlR family transcriptional regulator